MIVETLNAFEGDIGASVRIEGSGSPWFNSPFRCQQRATRVCAEPPNASMLLQGLAVGFAPTEAGLTLSLFNNTALAGRPSFSGLVPTPNYTHATGGASFSALI